MAKKELFGRPQEEISELALEGSGAPPADATNYVNQPTSAELPAAFGENVPKGRFLEQVLKGSDEVKEGAVDAHPAENQPG